MVLIYNTFIKSAPPKFMQRTIDLLFNAEKILFLSLPDFDIFVDRIKKQLEQDRPVGSDYALDIYRERGKVFSGQVTIHRRNKLDTDVVRLSFYYTNKVLRWAEGKDDFVNVVHRLYD